MKLKYYFSLIIIIITCSFATCKYSTKDVAPIPPEIKTFRVQTFQNKARYVNPQIAPQLTQAVKQQIIGQTRLRQINDDVADYDISGYLSNYSVTTSGIANQQSSVNRLNVTFHLIFKNNHDVSTVESDITNSYDFSAGQTLQQAEQALSEKILKNISEGIFNKIFSNW
ncbi:MAG: LPS assembly lipoprotein LptE [Ginsengibacter sp.]